MRSTILAAILVLVLGAAFVVVASADGGPHGDYTATTDKCAGCHRAHTGQAAYLLYDANLCVTCHGAGASGADTNVMDGVYLNRLSGGAYGTVNRGLKGGGYTNARMDTDLTGPDDAASQATTSAHTYDGSTGTLWGAGTWGSGAGEASFALSCQTCHNPHGNGDYRILRSVPTGSGGSGVSVTDEITPTYTIADAASYWQQSYGTRAIPLANWCSQCHDRHEAGANSATTLSDAAETIYRYRHTTTTGAVNCMDCHVAHGTSAAASGYAASVPYPGGASGDEASALLRLDNRGVCQQCHSK